MHRQRHALARAGGRRPRARRSGRSTSAASASTSGPTRPPTPTTPTSCASTSTRSPAPTSTHDPRGAAEVRGAARRARHRAATRRPPATAGCTSTSGSCRAGTPTQVRSAAVAAARELERRRPDLITAAWWKEERGERIFVDFNQNAPHKTVFGAWSVRAPGPAARCRRRCAGRRSPSSHPDELTLATVPGRLDGVGDPWADDRRRPAVARAAARAARAGPRRTACSTPRGRRCTPSSPTSRLGWRPAAPAGTTPDGPAPVAGVGTLVRWERPRIARSS